MLTHYVRRKVQGTSNKLNNALEGVVVQMTPSEHLVTGEELYRHVAARCLAEGIEKPAKATVVAAAEDLAQRGFLHEVHGSRIQRMLAS